MKKIVSLAVFYLIVLSVFAERPNPVANPSAVVLSGNVRFTILTPRTIRMEWDGTKRFTDNASFIAVNRNLEVPKFTQSEERGWLIITTEELELRYKKNSGKFTDKNLFITFNNRGSQHTWKISDQQQGNLKGTYRTNDRYDGNVYIDTDGTRAERMPLEEGVLSTDGWTLLDDSDGFLFDNSEWAWVEQRKNKKAQDLYFIAYGNNYKQALKDFSLFSGKVPLSPRYAFGYWWSRYWNYSDNEIRSTVAEFEKYNLPLDVFVLDMDWHKIDSINSPYRDEFGQRKHWTGWDWDTNLFTDPSAFLKWTDSKKLKQPSICIRHPVLPHTNLFIRNLQKE